jgi:hypothetical protein
MMAGRQYRWGSAVAIAMLVAACAPATGEPMTNAADMRSMLARDVPVGTSAATVVAYLDSAGVENSGFIATDRAINAIWRDVSTRGIVKQSIRADFRFDSAGRLTTITVRDQFTGP